MMTLERPMYAYKDGLVHVFWFNGVRLHSLCGHWHKNGVEVQAYWRTFYAFFEKNSRYEKEVDCFGCMTQVGWYCT